MRLSAYERKLRDKWKGVVVTTPTVTQTKRSIDLDLYPDPEQTLTVYRLEIPIEVGGSLRTFGPFCASAYRKELEQVTWRYKRQLRGAILEPHEDGIPIDISGTELVCGFFACDRSFLMWGPWKDTWEQMEDVGFRINAYELKQKHLHIGGHQVCWDPKHATIVRSLAYDELTALCSERF